MLSLACTRPSETPPPQPPTANTQAPPPATVPDQTGPATESPDILDDLRGDDDVKAEVAPRPEPFEVLVDAVMAKEDASATLLMVGADPRFTLHMRIDGVEPPTPLLEPGRYAVVIHSPSKTFRGPVPRNGKHIQFKMTIYPEDPNDPHDEVFFSSLWIE